MSDALPDAETPDFVMGEDGLMVATRAFLLRRGYCCGNGCRNCPYRGTPLDRCPAWLRLRDGGGQSWTEP